MSNDGDEPFEISRLPGGQAAPQGPRREYEGIRRAGFWLGMLGIGVLFAATQLCALAGHSTNDSAISLFGRVVAFIGVLATIVLSFVLIFNRLRNLGMGGVWALLTLIPIANLFLAARCAICPEGYADTKKLDRSGRILASIMIGCVVGVIAFINNLELVGGLLVLAGVVVAVLRELRIRKVKRQARHYQEWKTRTSGPLCERCAGSGRIGSNNCEGFPGHPL